jgi:hypothetical protein
MLGRSASGSEAEVRNKLRHRPFLIFDLLAATQVALSHDARTVFGRYDLFEFRTALMDDQIIAGEIPGFVVQDQMETLDQKVLQHLFELFFRGVGRHRRDESVPGR